MTDLIDPVLATNDIRVTVQQIFDSNIDKNSNANLAYTRSPKDVKSLGETYLLIKKVIDNIQTRANTPNNHKVIFTEEEPDEKLNNEIITFSLVQQLPGTFGQGSPNESKVRNQKLMYRESIIDPEHPGYRLGIFGKFFDNVVRFTCWARTNKEANKRVEWLEDVLDEYMWYFKQEGVDRFLFIERHADMSLNIQGNKWYGRPIDYFIRTEKIKIFAEKRIEELLVKVKTSLEI